MAIGPAREYLSILFLLQMHCASLADTASVQDGIGSWRAIFHAGRITWHCIGHLNEDKAANACLMLLKHLLLGVFQVAHFIGYETADVRLVLRGSL